VIIKTLLCFSYIVIFLTVSTIFGDFILTGVDGYEHKWQAIGLGTIILSIFVSIIHLIYFVIKIK